MGPRLLHLAHKKHGDASRGWRVKRKTRSIQNIFSMSLSRCLGTSDTISNTTLLLVGGDDGGMDLSVRTMHNLLRAVLSTNKYLVSTVSTILSNLSPK